MRLLAVFTVACVALAWVEASAQPVSESPVAAPSAVETPAPVETAEPAPVVEETGPAAELRKAVELLKSDPSQAAPNSQVEQELTRLSAAADAMPEAIYNLGVFYLRINDREKARFRFQQTLEKDPNFADAIAQLGVMAAATDPAKANALIDQAINLDKYCAPARNYLSQQALREGRLDDVIKHCRIALLGDPDNLNAYLNMAIALFKKGQIDVGKLVCQSALTLDPENSPILNLLGLMHLEEDDVKAAITLFQASIQADPENLDARRNLASVTLNFKDYETAVGQFEEVLKRQPDNEEFKVSYAVALRGMQRFDEAKNVLVKVLAANQGNLEARYNYCILLHEYLQDYSAALQTCSDFRATLDKKHPKWKEMDLRIKGIRETISAMEEMKKLEKPEEKPPDTPPPPPVEEKKEPAAPPAPEPAAPGGVSSRAGTNNVARAVACAIMEVGKEV